MKDYKLIEQDFEKIFFTLDEELIFSLSKSDLSGQVNNVLIGLNRECYGVRLFEEEDKQIWIEIFYIQYNLKVDGNLIRIALNDQNYSYLLFLFCSVVALNFEGVNEIHAFNTFQKQLRTLLEKDGYYTITNIDIEELKKYGSDGMLINIHHKGIKKIDVIPMVDFYREIFDDNFKIINENPGAYVYLMVNTETALIKIGFSKKPQYREKTLQSQEPQVHLIACWKADRSIETSLHRKFKKNRVRGEYFKLSLHDLRLIKDNMQVYNDTIPQSV